MLEEIQGLETEQKSDYEHAHQLTTRSKAIKHFLVYWVFLLFILAAVFAPPYTTHFYRQTHTFKAEMLENEIADNVFFENAMNADQMYDVSGGAFGARGRAPADGTSTPSTRRAIACRLRHASLP